MVWAALLLLTISVHPQYTILHKDCTGPGICGVPSYGESYYLGSTWFLFHKNTKVQDNFP
jgi:hypothetical protein